MAETTGTRPLSWYAEQAPEDDEEAMITRCNNMPFGTCPKCGKEWQIDDYYELENDSVVTCPNCETGITLSEKEEVVSFTFTAETDEAEERAEEDRADFELHRRYDERGRI